MRRRTFLKAGLVSAGVYAFGPSFWREVYSAPAMPGPGPYGALLPADANGVMLPPGFTSKIVAVSGEPVGSLPAWHPFPDGGATFATPDGGWVYVSNSEVPFAGGVGALKFAPDGEIDDAYRILTGTSVNCAGGPTPWGTWLSCEEYDFSDTPVPPQAPRAGRVWECDPQQAGMGEVRPALGAFSHEAVAVDPVEKKLYLTEDQGDGRFYRFTPTSYPDLTAGTLEVAQEGHGGAITWLAVPDPSAAEGPTREQVPSSTAYDGGEGIWYDAGFIYFTTKGDNKVRSYEVATQRIEVIYDAAQAGGDDAPLRGVDNITMSRSGDLYVAEDGGNLEIVIISREREVAPFLRIANQTGGGVEEGGTELAGPAFDPSGTRFYFSSQRASVTGSQGLGLTYEISGPFRTAAAQTAPTTTTTMAALPSTGDDDAGAGGSLPATGIGPTLGAVGAAAAAAAAAARAASDVSRKSVPRSGESSSSLARPQDEGIAGRSFEDENAASGDEDRRDGRRISDSGH